MSRFTTAALIGLALALVAPVAQAANPVVGVADQKASSFSSPLFRGLHVKRRRYVVPWNVALVRTQRTKFDAWLRSARAAHVRDVLIVFNARARRCCPARPCRR